MRPSERKKFGSLQAPVIYVPNMRNDNTHQNSHTSRPFVTLHAEETA